MRDQEIHFKQRYFRSGQFQLRILSGAERRRKSAEWVLENSVSLNDVYVSKENENYFSLSLRAHCKQVSSVEELVLELLLRFFFKFKIQTATSLCK